MFLSRLGELRRATPKAKGAHRSSSAAAREVSNKGKISAENLKVQR